MTSSEFIQLSLSERMEVINQKGLFVAQSIVIYGSRYAYNVRY